MAEHRAPIPDQIARWAQARPDADAIVEIDGPRWSYQKLARAVDESVAQLRAAGVRDGDRIAFAGPPSAAFVVSMAAAHRLGAVWLGLNPRYTAPETERVLQQSGARLLQIGSGLDRAHMDIIGSALERMNEPPAVMGLTYGVDAAAEIPVLPNRSAVSLPADAALLVFTSGTTGTPKGALLTHAGLAEASRLYQQAYGVPRGRFLNNLPVNHVGAVVDIAASALWSGAAMVCMAQFEPDRIARVASEERLTHLGQIPSMYALIEQHGPLPLEALPELQHLIWSGAPMPRPLIERYWGRGPALSTCYGLTEITGSITFTRPNASLEELAQTIGAPLAADAFRLHPTSEAPQGALEVQVRGALAMAGYFENPSASADAFTSDGWLKTGDLAESAEDGAIRLIGRTKEMFKSGGYNVYPREIEAVLETHPAVESAIVVAVPHDLWGEVGHAFVTARGGADTAEIALFARRRLANYKLPKRFEIVSDLPYLPNGKVDRRALTQRARASGA